MKWVILFLAVFLVGCTTVEENIDLDPIGDPPSQEVNADEMMKEKAINLCIKKCEAYEEDLSSGPCLDGDIVNNWACDVAHDPREDVDNLEENQCDKYRTGESEFFVEVDENCELIITG